MKRTEARFRRAKALQEFIQTVHNKFNLLIAKVYAEELEIPSPCASAENLVTSCVDPQTAERKSKREMEHRQMIKLLSLTVSKMIGCEGYNDKEVNYLE